MIRFIALFLLACFYGTYFIKQILQRRKGIRTDQMGKGEKPKRTIIVETSLKTITYINGVIQFACTLFSQYMLPVQVPLAVSGIGLVIAFCGVVFLVLAITEMRDTWRAGINEQQSTDIVKTGVFKYSRNPAFVGFDMLAIGMALAIPGIIVCVGAVLSLLFFHLQILEEEKYLYNTFGDEYIGYKQSTPRYLLFI